MFIKPAPGKTIRDPLSRLVISELGIEVAEHDTYWIRRLADGDVVEAKPAPKPKTAPSAKE